jgi:hypothetical protein
VAVCGAPGSARINVARKWTKSDQPAGRGGSSTTTVMMVMIRVVIITVAVSAKGAAIGRGASLLRDDCAALVCAGLVAFT